MHRTLILIAGLIVMALLAIWCLDRHVGEIQTDILMRANDALAAADLRLGASVSGQDVTLTGVVETERARDDATSLVTRLAGVRLVDNQVTVRASAAPASGPYFFAAQLEQGRMTLSGNVPDDAARASIVGAARQAFRGSRVVDELVQRPGAPMSYATAVKAALPRLAQLEQGRLEFNDRRVTMSGVATGSQIINTVESALAAGLPQGYSASSQLRLMPQSAASVAACQTSFDRIMTGNIVHFSTGSARISADSFPLLDDIAAAVKACGDVAVEVQGHTDSEGAPQSNLALSQRRAEAVVDYLLREGVADGQVAARGYGEAQPVASNDTPAGRTMNRRIEFHAGGSEDSER